MKKAPPVRLSLRKLLLAMLAVGPLAILPSPVWATLPTYTSTTNSGSFVVTSGSVLSTTATGIIQASDRAVLVWGTGNFNIGSGETYNFANAGAVLNKVGYNTNGTLGTVDNAIINGTLLSSGKVFVLANGNIQIGGGANITSTQGTVLSTLVESSDFPFTTGGNLALSGANSQVGAGITVGTGASLVNVAGSLGLYSGSVALNNVTVSGDLVVNQSASASGVGLVLTGAGGPTTVNGNLTATTNAGAISQGAGALLVPGGTTTLNTGGNVAITLGGANNFSTVNINDGTTVGGITTLNDINDIVLGPSVIGQNLNVTAAGNITTGGTVTVPGVVTLQSTGAGVAYTNNSTAGTFSVTSAPNGVTFSGLGNVITTGITSGAAVSITTNGTVTVGGTIATANNVTVSAGTISANATGAVGATANVVSLTSNIGGVTLPAVTANTLTVATSNANVSQVGSLLIGNATTNGNVTIGAGTGNISLPLLTNNMTGATGAAISMVGNNATVNNLGKMIIGTSNLTGSLTINTSASASGAATVTIGSGQGTAATGLTVGGALNITTNNSAVSDDSFVAQTILGAVTINTNSSGLGGAAVTLNAAAASPDGDRTQFGALNVNAGTGAVVLSETTTMNLGNITGAALTFRTQQSGSDILINGQLNATGAVLFNTNPSGGNVTEGSTGNINFTGAMTYNGSGNSNLNLSTPTNLFTGLVTLQNGVNDIIVAGSNITFITNNVTGGPVNVSTVGATANTVTFGFSGTSNASNVTINSAGPIIIGGGTMSVNRLTLISGDTGANSITQMGSFSQMNGTLTLSSQGNVVLTASNNITGSVVLNNQVGDAAIFSSRNLTISGTSAGNLTAVAGANPSGGFSGPWNLTFGNLNVKGLTAGAANGNTTIAPLTALSIAVTAGGSGYTSAPTVNVSGGNGITATATVTGGVVTGVTVSGVASSTSYVAAPIVTFTGGGGSGAAAVATATLSAASPNGAAAGGNATAGSSGNVQQSSNTSLHVENTADFVTFNGNVLLSNAGNSFGRVQASTGGGSGLAGTGNITITEDSTLKIGLIQTVANATLTSRFGSIIEDPVLADTINVNGTGSVLTATASNGSILLGNLDHTAFTTTANVTSANVTALGAAKLVNTADSIVLAGASVNSLTVTSGNIISQSAPLKVFGTATFNTLAGKTGDIQLTNTANNFGPVSLTTAVTTANIAVSEDGTLNLRSVSMPAGANGTFTATSSNGDIIDTGLGGVKPGGATGASGSGVVTLSAVNGNITIDDPTTDFQTTGGVNFNGKNVTLAVLGGTTTSPITLTLGSSSGASVASGNLTVTSILGDIVQLGTMSVTGNAFFQTGTKNITLGNATNSFGGLKFIGNQVNIQQAGDMKILTGSSATGAANLASNGGSITIVKDPSAGLVTFGNVVNMSATTTITLPKLMQAVGTLSVTSAGTKDLSALSITQDLGGKTPLNSGTGAYVPPQP